MDTINLSQHHKSRVRHGSEILALLFQRNLLENR
jgi:hypothetical protein